jgi:hypothetical protein
VGEFELPDGSSLKLYIAPQIVQPLDKDGQPNKNAWVVPFWFVRTTTDAKEANMTLSWEVRGAIKGIAVRIPVLKNPTVIKAGAELVRFQAEKSTPEPPTGSIAQGARKKQRAA